MAFVISRGGSAGMRPSADAVCRNTWKRGPPCSSTQARRLPATSSSAQARRLPAMSSSVISGPDENFGTRKRANAVPRSRSAVRFRACAISSRSVATNASSPATGSPRGTGSSACSARETSASGGNSRACMWRSRSAARLARVHVAQQVGCARILPCAHEEPKGALQQQILLRRLLHLTRADARFLGRLGARDLAGLQILEDVLHDLAHLLLRGLQLRARGRRLRRRGERGAGDEQQDAESGHGVSPPSPVRSPPRGGPSAS